MTTAASARKMLLLGAGGQLGRELLQTLAPHGQVIGTIRRPTNDPALADCRCVDLQDSDAISHLIDEARPTVVINAAAYTAVDQAEKEEVLALEINGHAVGRLAEMCAARNIPLVHYSTDYVFDGAGIATWQEESPTYPLNAYGRSKLLGEELIRRANPPHLIARTSWVYGAHGHNFVKTMLRLGRDRPELRVISDQVGAPTSARALADATGQLIAQTGPDLADALRQRGGLVHMVCGGDTSWHGFAEEIFRLARAEGFPLKIERVIPIASSEYPTPAQRPLNSRLDCSKLARSFGLTLPSWQEALAASFPEICRQMA
jgi:dTDP-4-dehydrorhamnose reductase